MKPFDQQMRLGRQIARREPEQFARHIGDGDGTARRLRDLRARHMLGHRVCHRRLNLRRFSLDGFLDKPFVNLAECFEESVVGRRFAPERFEGGIVAVLERLQVVGRGQIDPH